MYRVHSRQKGMILISINNNKVWKVYIKVIRKSCIEREVRHRFKVVRGQVRKLMTKLHKKKFHKGNTVNNYMTARKREA